MFRPSSGVFCLLCNHSVLRKRRMTITRTLFDENAEAAVIISEILQPYLVWTITIFIISIIKIKCTSIMCTIITVTS